MKVKAVRVFGDVVGETDAYIDCDVSGVTPDGNIILVEQASSPREWRITNDNFRDAFSEGTVKDLSGVDKSAQIWSAIGKLANQRAALPEQASDPLREAIRNAIIAA